MYDADITATETKSENKNIGLPHDNLCDVGSVEFRVIGFKWSEIMKQNPQTTVVNSLSSQWCEWIFPG